jgi:hypothetical protein
LHEHEAGAVEEILMHLPNFAVHGWNAEQKEVGREEPTKPTLRCGLEWNSAPQPQCNDAGVCFETSKAGSVCARRGALAERDSWCGLGRAGAPISTGTAMNSRRLLWIESLAFRPRLGVYGRADRSLRGRCCRASLGFLLFGLFSFAIAALFTFRHSISLLRKLRT